MKITETTIPAEKTFSIELSESELSALFCAFGDSCAHDRNVEARKNGLPELSSARGDALYDELRVALGKRGIHATRS